MDTRRGGDRVLRVVRVAGVFVLLVGLVWLGVVLATGGVDTAGRWASVLSVGVAITAAVIGLVTSWLQQRPAAGELAGVEQSARAAEVLQAVVREQWRKEAEVRSLWDPDPMPVRWRLSDPTVMDHDEHIVSKRLRLAGRSDQIPALTDQFRQLRRRRLVIIGGPGSGKTTLAVQLVLQLLEGWEAEEPVPVLFSLASWDPHTQPRVQDWLASQLNQTYPDLRAFGPDTAQRLADQGRLLPVLDGLDEIPVERRAEVIDRLNASLHPDTGVIVTSRTAEYTETVHAGDVLTAAAVIEAQPLTASEAATYLKNLLPRQAGDSWQAVLTALRDGTAGGLAEVVASPLGLWLLRAVHIQGRRNPQPLIDRSHYPNPAAIHNHLLEELIPAAVHGRPPLPSGQDPLRPKRRQDPEQVRRWLTSLAIELRDTTTRDWRWWQLARHTWPRQQIRLTVPLVFVLLGGLVTGPLVYTPLMLLEGYGLRNGLRYGLLTGLLIGLMGGLVFAVVGGGDAPAHVDFRLRGRATTLRSELLRGLGRGLVFGLVFGLLSGLVLAAGILALVEWMAIMIFLGLVLGLLLGIIRFATSPSIAQRASSPAENHRGDRQLTILATSMLMLGSGLTLGLLGGLGYALALGSDKLVIGLRSGLLWGMGLALGLGPVMIKTCWPTFVLVSLWLGARRRLPVRLMEFLDDAYRLGLLRIVGPVYQFRHAALQDHLAPPAESMATSAVAPSALR